METAKTTVGVIGAGAMGSGIAQLAAQAGHPVVLVDQSADAIDRSAAQLAKVADRLIEKGKWTLELSRSVQERIHRTTELTALESCDWIVEAIVENLDAKQSLFQ